MFESFIFRHYYLLYIIGPETLHLNKIELEQLEIDLLLDAVYKESGYDFRNYAGASLQRRIHHLREKMGESTISGLIPLILYNGDAMRELIQAMSIMVTEMFRDPEVFLFLREEIIPYLKTFPFIRIWVAGCASGEEVYSLAILLSEEGLYERCQIYATDYNSAALQKAEEGIYNLDLMKDYMENYRKSGGKDSLSRYFHSQYDSVIMDSELKRNITFAAHNLATDTSFCEANLILCRNVMIYFNGDLQARALELFRDSLVPNGFLCLGTREGILSSGMERYFETVSREYKVYKKLVIRS